MLIQKGFQEILENRTGNCDANGRACRTEGVARRGDDCLVFMVHGRYEGEESDSQHGAVPKATDKQEDVRRYERHILVEEREDECCSSNRQRLATNLPPPVLAAPAHVDACQQRSCGHADCLRDELRTSFGCRYSANDLEENRPIVNESENRLSLYQHRKKSLPHPLTYHCHEPIGQKCGRDRSIEQQAHWNNGLRSDPVLDVYEDEQEDEAEWY